ncbi:hypothetical protein [Niabella ginsengisoli]|uniref:Restriction endonuclease n=1 Tax=Niabella ginsengisoli TaxID=522298 RepID=A0ABS9SJW7_9BACT|nr:hypothetical protein [Niabella ginsengisoli]MCH5598659.1 hypothetical protein [Niabella ginsengisoli]
MTAKDLLYKILDYNYLWSSPDRKNSKPAKIRLSQIEILLESFGLTKKHVNPIVQIKYSFTGNNEKLNRAQQLNKLTNLEYVLGGEFLHDREKDANKELSDKVLLKISALYPDLVEHINQRPVDIGWLFNNLLNFRQEIYKVTFPNGGMLEGFSSGLHYSFYLQRQLKEIIKANIIEIDETLWQILDPLKRDISKEQIKYIDADLDDIDLEWRMENY